MRDLFVTLLVFASLPGIMMRPHLGVLVWSWLGYMNPHRLTWGFAYNFPFSQLVAGTLLLSFALSSEPKRFPLNRLTVVWLFFIGWMCVTTTTAMYPEAAQELLSRILKIQLVVFITIMLMNSRERLEQLLWVIVVSLGFFGVKGGIFLVTTASNSRIYGPGGFISDNNALSIALLLTLPLINYLRVNTDDKRLRYFLVFCMLTIGITIIGTYSRAAFVGALAMSAMIWVKSERKAITAVVVLAALPILYFSAPQAYRDRIATITETEEQTGEMENSAQSRLDVWAMIFRLSKHRPIFGAGLDPWHPATYDRYAPDPDKIKKAWAAHSIYFSVLAEHGYVGLILFLVIYWTAYRTAGRIIVDCNGLAGADWLSSLMRMLQLSLAGFLVAGAFHQLPYFDLPWHIIGIIVISRGLANDYMAAATDELSGQTTRDPASVSGAPLAAGHE